ncbi:prolipoprotein diacylglyceryl transferase [Ruminiclostridium cellobioparum]|uniref:Phosphatidylglycerol--prolipoprotein diacylglyceryl transferase n=1 Tax=Ruminiclostridium cellobioparum subsp. termitidis CT1112 TaxID=1195236 RepID=S0FL88_RUMCE|nr:prolipoprotein diacylglyceryl transferase [Ruminiclostridium cellobioparum]EMS72975.1 prolipoprotein diacylglyceryl transferase [Ruminiclostridium cellobioparum subsp. termitidis CT1112]
MDDRVTVSFPNMGLDFDISREAFKVFGISIYWYGIIIALAFFICVLWAMRDSRKFDLVPETIIDLMLFAAPIAIICARLYFVIFSWDNYKYDLKQIFNTRNGGLAILGGIIGAVITAYFVARYKKIPTFKLFDFAIPYVALGQAIGRWGNFFNQEAFGTNTNLPWGMTSPTVRAYLQNLQNGGMNINPDLPVHPTFLYESLWDIAVFIFLLQMRKKKKFNGEIFCLYFITYGIGRAVIEGLRTDSLMLGSLRVSQLLSIIFVIVFSIIVIYKRIKIKNSFDDVEIGQSGYASILKIMDEEETAQGTENNGQNAEAGSGVSGDDVQSSEDEVHEKEDSTQKARDDVGGADGSSQETQEDRADTEDKEETKESKETEDTEDK